MEETKTYRFPERLVGRVFSWLCHYGLPLYLLVLLILNMIGTAFVTGIAVMVILYHLRWVPGRLFRRYRYLIARQKRSMRTHKNAYRQMSDKLKPQAGTRPLRWPTTSTRYFVAGRDPVQFSLWRYRGRLAWRVFCVEGFHFLTLGITGGMFAGAGTGLYKVGQTLYTQIMFLAQTGFHLPELGATLWFARALGVLIVLGGIDYAQWRWNLTGLLGEFFTWVAFFLIIGWHLFWHLVGIGCSKLWQELVAGYNYLNPTCYFVGFDEQVPSGD